MAKQKRNSGSQSARKMPKAARNLYLLALIVFVVKIIIMLNIPHGGWYGADGENYASGTDGLLNDGIFSKKSILNYWPAGYPILMWILAKISITNLFFLLSLFQTLAYSLAGALFVEQVRRTRLSFLAWWLAIFLYFNPTLSLSSYAVGYESLVASCMLASVALIIRYQLKPSAKELKLTVLWVGLLQGLSAFVQPRGLVMGFFIFLIWGLYLNSRKTLAAIVIAGCAVMAVMPLGLVVRNIKAVNMATISTNLGVTMNIGAGDHATGAYASERNKNWGVNCPPTPPATSVSDSQKVNCVVKWYLTHPVKSASLFFHKSLFYWSPWFGPVAEGTMNRNPWLKVNPLKNIAESSKTGSTLVYGTFGKIVSWLWLLGGLALLVYGFRAVWRLGGLERQLAALAGAPVLLGMLTAAATIGDHRFRLPTLGLSIFLQVAGIMALMRRFPAPTLEGKPKER
jgi:hypothetical protein